MNDHAQNIEKQRMASAQQQINEGYDILVTKNRKPRIPETVFVTYFLPFFSGQSDKVHPSSNSIAKWIGVAGTPMSEVEVIDTAGNVLYTVPALFETNLIDITNKRGRRISDLLTEFHLRNAAVPRAAVNFLQSALLQKHTDMATSEVNLLPSEGRWLLIFKRYGILSPVSQGAAQADQQDNDDVIYD